MYMYLLYLFFIYIHMQKTGDVKYSDDGQIRHWLVTTVLNRHRSYRTNYAKTHKNRNYNDWLTYIFIRFNLANILLTIYFNNYRIYARELA